MTLIELLFSMVIVALVFSVIPRVIFISNKSIELSSKEDAIFNMMSKMMDISIKEFDENNTQTDEILLAEDSSDVLLCNSDTGYRVGGFKGGRNCLNSEGNDSDIKADEDPPYDDVDDYNGTEENTTSTKYGYYTLKINVGYTKEFNSSDYNNKKLDFNFTNLSDNSHRNIKRIYIYIQKNDKNISSIVYYSTNIGHAKIESEIW